MATNTPNKLTQIANKFPSDMAESVAMSFIVKEVNLNADFEKAAAEAEKQFTARPNGAGRVTLAETMLRNGELRASIALPIPNAFSEQVGHEWAETTGLATDVVSGAMDKLGSAGKFISKAVGQTAANTGIRMPATDPGYFQKYTGTKTREFSFQWDFVIRDAAEAKTITKIIKIFKEYSAPSQLVSNVALIAPNFWIVQVHNKYLSESLRLQPMVVKSVNVNYAASSTMELYNDGTPKYMSLSIQMSEISAITRQTYGAPDTISVGQYAAGTETMKTAAATPAPAPAAGEMPPAT